MSGFFDLKRSGSQFMYNLKSTVSGEVVLTSELYTSKQGAQSGIAAVKAYASLDGRYRRLLARDNQQYFTLTAANTEVVGVSEMYSSINAREGGITWVMAYGPGAATVDNT